MLESVWRRFRDLSQRPQFAFDLHTEESVEELQQNAPAKLGQILRTGAGSTNDFSEIVHLVVRVPSDPELIRLPETLGELSPGRLDRFLLPLFGKTFDVPRWEVALASWISRPRNIQEGRVSVLIRVPPDEQEKAEQLELNLIRRGSMVGRAHEPGGEPLTSAGTFKQQLVDCVRRGTLSPEAFAHWLYSGATLTHSGWQRHLTALS